MRKVTSGLGNMGGAEAYQTKGVPPPRPKIDEVRFWLIGEAYEDFLNSNWVSSVRHPKYFEITPFEERSTDEQPIYIPCQGPHIDM